MKKYNSHIWIVIIALFILNIVSYVLALWSGYIDLVGIYNIKAFFIFILGYILTIQLGYIHIADIAAIGWLVLYIIFIIFSPLTIINIISNSIFLIAYRPEGKIKILTYAFLAISIYLFMRYVIN